MRKIITLLFISIVIVVTMNANILKDINSTIPHLDTKQFDPVYYKHKLINNIPFQQNRINKKFFFNPLYVAYYLRDYYYKLKTGNNEYKSYIDILLDNVIDKSSVFLYNDKKVRVFYYEPSGDVLRMFHKHFSALTQAQFVYSLAKIYNYTHDIKYYNLAKEFANSFFVKIEDNGVLYDNNGTVSFAEVPTIPHGQTLNGWLSALVYLDKANRILKDKDLTNLLYKNVSTLDKVIDLYDIPEDFNSRYNLSQFYYFRLLNKSKNKLKIKKIIFKYPSGEKSIISLDNYNLKEKKSRWENYILNKYNVANISGVVLVDKILQINGVLTRLGYPKENKIIFEFDDNISIQQVSDSLKLEIYSTEYNPFYSGPINGKWKELVKKNKHNNLLEFSIPYKYLKTLGNGTNFIKKFKNGNKNVYHDVHITWLIYLGLKYDKQKLLNIANKWIDYKIKLLYSDKYKNAFKNKNIILDSYNNVNITDINYSGLIYLKYLVNLASNKIEYTNSKSHQYFSDEIIESKKGNSRDYAYILVNLLTNNKYFNYKIVAITTFDHKFYTLVELDLNGKKMVLDPTNNIMYKYSVQELMDNPRLIKDIIGNCKHKIYCNENFWKNIKKVKYLPYLKYKTLDKYFINKKDKKKFKFKFNSVHRLSSIVIEAYDTKSNQSISVNKIICKYNDINILINNVSEIKNKTMTILNIPSGLRCSEISLELKIKDSFYIKSIEINGK